MILKTVYIHIGVGKTGTSSIQKSLFDHKSDLINNSILYPLTGITGYAHHHLALVGAERLNSFSLNTFACLRAEILASNASSIVISSENFSYCSPSYIEDVLGQLDGFNVKIIFMARHCVPFFYSSYLEWFKTKRIIESPEDFFSNNVNSFDMLQRIKPWSNFISNDNIIVNVYDKKIRPDIVKFFYSILNTSIPSISRLDLNLSFNPCFIDHLLNLNKSSLSDLELSVLHADLMKIGKDVPVVYFNRDFCRYIYDTCLVNNSEFAEAYLDSADYDIFMDSSFFNF